MNYKNPTCRGCYALGTACGHCERCDADPLNPKNAKAATAQQPSDTLRERVAGIMSSLDIDYGGNRFHAADAAISLVLEEAAKVASERVKWYRDNFDNTIELHTSIATAIRNLGKEE